MRTTRELTKILAIVFVGSFILSSCAAKEDKKEKSKQSADATDDEKPEETPTAVPTTVPEVPFTEADSCYASIDSFLKTGLFGALDLDTLITTNIGKVLTSANIEAGKIPANDVAVFLIKSVLKGAPCNKLFSGTGSFAEFMKVFKGTAAANP